MKKAFTFLVCLTAAALSIAETKLDTIILPEGFSIDLYADDISGARSLALAEDGTLFVGTRNRGRVYALRDTDGDFVVDSTYTIARGLNSPNGVAIKDGDLYVAEIHRIIKFENITANLDNPPKYEIINSAYPKDRHHGWKFIRFGPEGKLYVPVGAPCNVCTRPEDIYASITRIDPDGDNLEIYAKGIRNTVGFDWHPLTGELWFTDNGRDMLGDNLPPDELNNAPVPGLHFGFPYLHGKGTPDPTHGKDIDRFNFTLPAIELGPHVAALGMRFYTGRQFPEKYHNQIFVAEHGSWNRSIPIGYRISLITLDGNAAVSYETFAEGWLQRGRSWGRPVDVLVLPDGSLLVSDDAAGAIYRISYSR